MSDDGESYGQFLEVFEDAALPLAESNEEEQKTPARLTRKWLEKNSGVLGKMFHALEAANCSQLEPSESNTSLASSLGEFTSTNSLASMGGASSPNSKQNLNPVLVPALVKKMVEMFDEFMHNHSEQESQVPEFLTREWIKKNNGIMATIFHALEMVNNTQVAPSASSQTRVSSSSSSASLGSSNSLHSTSVSSDAGPITASTVFGAMQAAVGVDEQGGSTASLASMNDSTSASGGGGGGREPKQSINPIVVPALVKKMAAIFDEFMRNHTYVEESEAADPVRKEIPKFC
mmetsp:Transcript_53935/g.110022  ORF Transcript_53935/g.110022 Transcript_53935/m.110022 type:complete len:290 (+) Transcript_53935:23-892(+)